MGIPPAFTVNLNGRKIFMSGTWENAEGEICADSTALFVTPKQQQQEGEIPVQPPVA
eukprot:gene34880-43009_t